MTDIPPERPPRRSRPNHLAAPPITQPQVGFEGLEILREMDGPTGVLLAGALRDVMLWVETSPRDRAAFGIEAGEHRLALLRSAEIDTSLRGALATLARMMGRVEPGGGNEDLLLACQEIASWADFQGARATQLAFAQACALLEPHDAKVALIVARLARDLGQTARAESWFRHTVRLARNRDKESYGWAFIGLGVLFMRAGNLPGSHAVIVRALQHATRYRLRELTAVSHHHLFHLATESGRIREAYTHALTALGSYEKTHPRLRDLAGDVGRFWLHLKEFRRALPVIEAVVDGYPEPNGRAMVTAIIAFAAAGAGNIPKFESARDAAEERISETVGRLRIAETYCFLSYANSIVGDWERAEAAASRSLELAIASGEAEVQILAEAALKYVRSRESDGPSAVQVENPALTWEAERLASALVQALKAGPNET